MFRIIHLDDSYRWQDLEKSRQPWQSSKDWNKQSKQGLPSFCFQAKKFLGFQFSTRGLFDIYKTFLSGWHVLHRSRVLSQLQHSLTGISILIMKKQIWKPILAGKQLPWSSISIKLIMYSASLTLQANDPLELSPQSLNGTDLQRELTTNWNINKATIEFLMKLNNFKKTSEGISTTRVGGEVSRRKDFQRMF